MAGRPQDARLKKLLTAFNVLDHWPKLEQRGVRNVFALAKLSDQELVGLLHLDQSQLRKMRAVLTKLEAARAQHRGEQQQKRASANPQRKSQQSEQQQQQPQQHRGPAGVQRRSHAGTAAAAASSSSSSSNRNSRVLNLAPAPGFSGPIDGALHRVPSRTQRGPPSRGSGGLPAGTRQSRKSYDMRSPPKKASSSSSVKTRSRPSKAAQYTAQPLRRSLWDFDFDVDVLPTVVCECWATKCGGKVKSWQKRYFVLRNDGSLTYSKEGALSDHKGVIDVRDATVINGPGSCNWLKEDGAPPAAEPSKRVEIVTPVRTFKLFCDTQADATMLHSKLQEVWKYCKRAKKRAPLTERDIAGGEGYQRMLAEVAHVMTAQ
ncbi:hypothetical protein PTSG_05823 [Salpingoeca rosetta]|uniref:PH domain-containing protein n=1 Tax=Salpingoeca rosetta (strain ATCC 50818 / BSB-021) TaxID=946362 RepID=F2UCW4_SALR5|nr:uncharacterized protein PTSG_05823 [Salpingoeca rosetta]EGD74459.1 hypothetical protein PTSG_05823 [Salpingoeca rosetta]|eukprot:XP_004992716.1 hypothetical protein PTSG_05823 [Salpingoeca rosetta]